MATVKLTFAAQPGLAWEPGDPTPDHSYAAIQLLDNRPHNEQLNAYYTCDNDRSVPLSVDYNELNRTVRVREIQPAAPCGGNYNPKTDDILFYRQTPLDYSYITFTDGAKLTAATLNLDNDQLLHLIQELYERLDETNPYWNVFPEFTCELEAELQCEHNALMIRMTQEELNVDWLQKWLGGSTTNTSYESGILEHEWNWDATSSDLSFSEPEDEGGHQLWLQKLTGWIPTTDHQIDLADHTEPNDLLTWKDFASNEDGITTHYDVDSLWDQVKAAYFWIHGLRNDVNFLLGLQPSIDGAYVNDVTHSYPVDSEGNAWDILSTGCKHVKLTFTMSTLDTYDVIYETGPYITNVGSVDGGTNVTLNFTWCNGDTDNVSFTKLAGPAGPTGETGARGATGDGFWIWRRGSLTDLTTMTPNMSNYEDDFNNLCYAVTHDTTAATNPFKGDAGHEFEKLSPQFGGPGNNATGDGDYTGYILRYEKRQGDTSRHWYCTNMLFPNGDIGESPVKFFWDDTDASTDDPGVGQFYVDEPTDMEQVGRIKISNTDANQNDVENLLSHWFSGNSYDPAQGLGVLTICKESQPSRHASFRVEALRSTWTDGFGKTGVEVDVACLSKSSATPFSTYTSGQDVEYDRVSMQFSKHGAVPAIPASWTKKVLDNEAPSAGVNWMDSLIKIPEDWLSFSMKHLSIVFKNQVGGSSTSNPNFHARVYYVAPQVIRSYPANAIGTDWYNNVTTVGHVSSIADDANDDRYMFEGDESTYATDVTLPGTNNGYIFIRCETYSIPSINTDVLATIELEGKIV
tara:strand:+ start:12101 stop:14503 length:2403 start_codon:yes stop_codon:yes gene_type:complete